MVSAPAATRSIGTGLALGLGGIAALVLFAGAFLEGATWSPATQRGGPGFLFVVGPALAGWFGVASWVRSTDISSLAEAFGLSALAAAPICIAGVTLHQVWTGAPPVLESLFSTAAVALVVSAIAAVCVRLSLEPDQE